MGGCSTFWVISSLKNQPKPRFVFYQHLYSLKQIISNEYKPAFVVLRRAWSLSTLQFQGIRPIPLGATIQNTQTVLGLASTSVVEAKSNNFKVFSNSFEAFPILSSERNTVLTKGQERRWHHNGCTTTRQMQGKGWWRQGGGRELWAREH